MQADLDLIKVDMHDFFTIGTDFGHLTVEIDWISTAGATGNDNTDDLCFLLHGKQSFLKYVKIERNRRLGVVRGPNIRILFRKTTPI